MRCLLMRYWLWIPLVLSQCAPVHEPQAGPVHPPLPAPAIRASPVAEPSIPTPASPQTPFSSAASFTSKRIGTIQFDGVTFDSRSHRLVIADQAGGPKSRFANAAAAAKSRGAIAAINGGFFDPDGKPLGKVVSQGLAAGVWNRDSSLCSGTYCEDSDGGMAIRSRATTESPNQAAYRELLQAGPMLIRNSQKVGGLNRDKKSSRSLLLWDGETRWWMGRTTECSLQELSDLLAKQSPTGWKVSQALNLDGGSSSELWASMRVRGGPKHSSHWWLKPARNYVLLLQR